MTQTVRLLTPDPMAHIDEAAQGILERTGMVFSSEEALDALPVARVPAPGACPWHRPLEAARKLHFLLSHRGTGFSDSANLKARSVTGSIETRNLVQP
jgi:hypothetical protein